MVLTVLSMITVTFLHYKNSNYVEDIDSEML